MTKRKNEDCWTCVGCGEPVRPNQFTPREEARCPGCLWIMRRKAECEANRLRQEGIERKKGMGAD